MNFFTKLAIISAFILPFGLVSADTHEDVTMDVLENVDSAEVTHEIKLPEGTDDHAEVNHYVELPEHANDDAEDHVNASHEDHMDDNSEVETPDVETPEIESPETDMPEMDKPDEKHM